MATPETNSQQLLDAVHAAFDAIETAAAEDFSAAFVNGWGVCMELRDPVITEEFAQRASRRVLTMRGSAQRMVAPTVQHYTESFRATRTQMITERATREMEAAEARNAGDVTLAAHLDSRIGELEVYLGNYKAGAAAFERAAEAHQAAAGAGRSAQAEASRGFAASARTLGVVSSLLRLDYTPDRDPFPGGSGGSSGLGDYRDRPDGLGGGRSPWGS